MPLNATILTLFPDMFPGALGEGVTGRALKQGLWSLDTVYIRDFAKDNYGSVDDTPFGGGAGMVMKPDVVADAIEAVPNPGRLLFMSPRGRVLDQAMAHDLASEEQITIICGRYEGLDQRVIDAYDIEEVSIGDYVLSGGEMAAMVVLDSAVRLIPGVVNNDETTGDESHENGLLEYPHYTRPAEWEDQNGVKRSVPDVLTSGHHKKIDAWRKNESLELTKKRRPDLWQAYNAKENQ